MPTRTSAAGCSSKIYKLPSDDLKAAKNVNEAPIVDNENVLSTRDKVQEKIKQSTLITIPVEVCKFRGDFLFHSNFDASTIPFYREI